jgi:spermidine synthase
MFNSFAEYPIGLVVAALMVFTRDSKSDRKSRLLDIGLPVILGVVTLLLVLLVEQMGLASTPPGLLACFGLPALAAYFLSRRHLRFALALAVILLASAFYGENHDELLATRSFFGLHRVSYDPATNQHQLAHGNTLHGQQSLTPELRSIPLAYYHPTGPVGDVFKLYGNQSTLRVGAVGLGAGALATYARAGQDWTFFEIDPAVASIASNPDYFTYLSNSSVPIKIRLGDARITLTSAPDAGFDILVLDAYSSDSIPVHLATREAIQLYVSKLAPKGIIAFHLSNQHLNLVPVLANLAADANLVCFDRHDQDVSEDEIRQGKAESRWLVMARNQQDLKKLIATGRWRRQKPDPSAPLWTDDYASLIQALE